MVDTQINDFEDLLSHHENIIYHIINKYGIRDPEKEFYQDGVIALWQAAASYDESKGKFSSYAYFKIEKEILSMIRIRIRQIEKQEAYKKQLENRGNIGKTHLELGFDPYLFQMIEQVLTKNQMKWFSLYVLQDLTIKEIAQQEDVTLDAVKNWARLAKRKIKKVLEQ
ncbi:sigma-70 family RNA polymerase sigma factor [Aquibacillus koreensis]|uniref:Sigma-70 family RNA polymerase sigma factor n=1 Tax=Aquibacillus koreensis TaxID=279446 RepID=A0A9X3WQV6_9BACI|nr:sigma-70 family RNA polymerase sigma factor [Aquibacillus koreensis]MCT2536662.1 sigma-70 family RNA polymerase sigma factor [Aquibacillus koreensis]MDC3422616.1 sigma-70 family RNA polymerase sigma factor [Aquibacillus koreensis]